MGARPPWWCLAPRSAGPWGRCDPTTVSAPSVQAFRLRSLSPHAWHPLTSLSPVIPAKPPVYGACKLLDFELEMVSPVSVFYWRGVCIHTRAGGLSQWPPWTIAHSLISTMLMAVLGPHLAIGSTVQPHYSLILYV